jgi:hypothetical protein
MIILIMSVSYENLIFVFKTFFFNDYHKHVGFIINHVFLGQRSKVPIFP